MVSDSADNEASSFFKLEFAELAPCHAVTLAKEPIKIKAAPTNRIAVVMTLSSSLLTTSCFCAMYARGITTNRAGMTETSRRTRKDDCKSDSYISL